MTTKIYNPELIKEILNNYEEPEFPHVPLFEVINEFRRLTVGEYIEPKILGDMIGESDCPLHNSSLNDIELNFYQAHRHYHGLGHIEELFSLIELLKNHFSYEFIVELQLVAFFMMPYIIQKVPLTNLTLPSCLKNASKMPLGKKCIYIKMHRDLKIFTRLYSTQKRMSQNQSFQKFFVR